MSGVDQNEAQPSSNLISRLRAYSNAVLDLRPEERKLCDLLWEAADELERRQPPDETEAKVATPGATYCGESSTLDEDSRPPELLARLLLEVYDELPDPEFIPDHEKEVRVRALRQRILQAVMPFAPIKTSPVKASAGPKLGDPHPPSCACWECCK